MFWNKPEKTPAPALKQKVLTAAEAAAEHQRKMNNWDEDAYRAASQARRNAQFASTSAGGNYTEQAWRHKQRQAAAHEARKAQLTQPLTDKPNAATRKLIVAAIRKGAAHLTSGAAALHRSQTELANLAGVNQTALQAFIEGADSLDDGELSRVSQFLWREGSFDAELREVRFSRFLQGGGM